MEINSDKSLSYKGTKEILFEMSTYYVSRRRRERRRIKLGEDRQAEEETEEKIWLQFLSHFSA